MNMNIETLLNEEVSEKAVKLAAMDPGTKEYSEAVDSVTKLMDRQIELAKFEQSVAQTEKQMKGERTTRIVKIIAEVLGVTLGVAQLIVSVWGAKKAWQFEESGTITSATGKRFMDRLFKR